MRTTKVANAIIMNLKGQILMTQRYDPQNPNIHLLWQIPGGGIERKETPQEACIREAFEETGLKVRLLTPDPFVVRQSYPEIRFILNVFLTEPISGTINTENDQETADAKWYTVDQIKNLKTLDNTMEMIEGTMNLWKKH